MRILFPSRRLLRDRCPPRFFLQWHSSWASVCLDSPFRDSRGGGGGGGGVSLRRLWRCLCCKSKLWGQALVSNTPSGNSGAQGHFVCYSTQTKPVCWMKPQAWFVLPSPGLRHPSQDVGLAFRGVASTLFTIQPTFPLPRIAHSFAPSTCSSLGLRCPFSLLSNWHSSCIPQTPAWEPPGASRAVSVGPHFPARLLLSRPGSWPCPQRSERLSNAPVQHCGICRLRLNCVPDCVFVYVDTWSFSSVGATWVSVLGALASTGCLYCCSFSLP